MWMLSGLRYVEGQRDVHNSNTAHLAYLVHKRGRKTSIIIFIILTQIIVLIVCRLSSSSPLAVVIMYVVFIY